MKFFSMCSTSGRTVQNQKPYLTLFDNLNNALRNNGLDWEDVVSVGLDNTNTNMGEHYSLKSRIHTENPETFVAGCNRHLAHIAACKGGQSYYSATGFDCEEYQINLFFFFNNRTRRKGILA